MAEQGSWSVFPLRRLITAQSAVAVLAALLGGLDNFESARSALAGAGICGIANIYAAWRVFRSGSGSASEYGELANLYRAEFGKFVMIGALSAVLFAVSEVTILAFVGGCLSAIVAGIVIAATFNPGVNSTHNTK